MDKILAVSENEFPALYQQFCQKPNWKFISIQSSDAKLIDWPPENVLTLVFDDTHITYGALQPFMGYHAGNIIRFVSQHHDCNFIIHCTAGISRSGAVATFLHEWRKAENYGVSDEQFARNNPHILPNQLVLKVLRGAYQQMQRRRLLG